MEVKNQLVFSKSLLKNPLTNLLNVTIMNKDSILERISRDHLIAPIIFFLGFVFVLIFLIFFVYNCSKQFNRDIKKDDNNYRKQLILDDYETNNNV
jgi:Ca2+-dependent lipid-binding protein